MREFCARYSLGEEAVEDIQKIVDASILQISRSFMNIPINTPKTAKTADKVRCKGTNKKGEPCRRYALEDDTCCKLHSNEYAEANRCEATKRNGEPCLFYAMAGHTTCKRHSTKEDISAVRATSTKPRCEGVNKKGEPCNFYALSGQKTCKRHTAADVETIKPIKKIREKLVARKAKKNMDQCEDPVPETESENEVENEDEIKNILQEFVTENKHTERSDITFRTVKKFVESRGIIITQHNKESIKKNFVTLFKLQEAKNKQIQYTQEEIKQDE